MGACGGGGPPDKVKPCREFVGYSLVLHETLLAGRLNGVLVPTHCICVPPFEARDLGQYQRVLVGESRWIVVGPFAQFLPVRRQEVAPPALLVVS
jgi:hypothetical protein